MRYYDDYGFPRYVSVAEKRARARRKLEQLRKKHPNIRPVVRSIEATPSTPASEES